MRVLMVGWELPPNNSGGLGVASLGIAKSLAQSGVDVDFVLPKNADYNYDFMNLLFANIKDTSATSKAYTYAIRGKNGKVYFHASDDLIKATLEYGQRIEKILENNKSDIVHSHDWLTFPAGMQAKKKLSKPLVTHVHATEIDRTGNNGKNEEVFRIEKEGLDFADKVISVSNFTKKVLIDHYDIPERKVEVVHNGIDAYSPSEFSGNILHLKEMGYKVVLYLGRITLQKGPDYFVKSAKIISEYEPKAIFLVVGSGDMQDQMINLAIQLGVLDRMFFTGFLRGGEKDSAFSSADVYVMPSVSEPFGITALEAIQLGAPLVISKQSGVSEVIDNCFKVDYWDVEEIANKVIFLLRNQKLQKVLIDESRKELPNLSWENAARKCLSVYKNLF